MVMIDDFDNIIIVYLFQIKGLEVSFVI